jgi:phage terminase large subunit
VRFARHVLNLRILPGEPKPGDKHYNAIATDWSLDPWLCELFEAVADVDRLREGKPTKFNHTGKTNFTVRACRGVGKTFGIAGLAHIWGFAYDPLVIAVMAPKLDHIKTRFMGEFTKIQGRAIPGYASLMQVGATQIHWKCIDPKNHFLIAETAKHPENIQGLRRRFTLYLMDESSGVEEPIFPVIHGNLSATDIGIFAMIGNPTKNQGSFAASHLNPKLAQDYYRIHVGPNDSIRFQHDWMAKMVRHYGETSPIVRIHCLGEFAADDAFQLIATQWVADALQREFDTDGSLPTLRVSVDVSDGGEDSTVCTVGQRYASHTRILRQRDFNFSLEKAQVEAADAAERMFLEHGGRKDLDDFVVDAVGVGAGCAGVLYDRGYRVIRYKGGEASDDPEKWRNRRTQSYLVARDAFRDGILSFAPEAVDDPIELEAQLCSVKRKVVGDDKLEDLVTREEMRREGIKSPDRADSLVMQFATQAPVFSPASHGKEAPLSTTQSTLLDGLS